MIDLSFSAEDYLYQAEHHKFYTTYGKVSEDQCFHYVP